MVVAGYYLPRALKVSSPIFPDFMEVASGGNNIPDLLVAKSSGNLLKLLLDPSLIDDP